MTDLLRRGDLGQAVTDLQTTLRKAGYNVPATAIYDDATVVAVTAVQHKAGLVEDGVYGPKTRDALAGRAIGHLLTEADIKAAADTLGVEPACVKAVNAVESTGCGFLPDGRPKILFERHVFYARLKEHGIDPAPWAAKMPAIVNTVRGGYAGGSAEYTRLAMASQICREAALEACSWGGFQIMGYHWQRLGYASIDAFVQAQQDGESGQLDAFVKFVAADKNLVKALKARDFAAFAKGYNGPDYAANLYDVKMARAYDTFSAGKTTPAEAAA